jgi:hypothetical protein
MGSKKFVDAIKTAEWDKKKVGLEWCTRFKDLVVGDDE